MRNRWALVAAVILAGLCAPVDLLAQAAADPAALPDQSETMEAPEAGGTGGGPAPEDGGGSSVAQFFTERVRLRANLLYNGYSDLQVTSRSIKQNDLGLGFAQPSLKAQNDAEEKSWSEMTEMIELLVDPLGEGDQTIWLFVGAGSRQAEGDFGSDRLEVKEPPIGIFSAGAMGNLGLVADGIRLDWEFRFTYSASNEVHVDELPAYEEELESTAMTYEARLVLVFDPALFAPCTEMDGARLQPYAGVLYRHMDLDETYTATSTSGVVGTSKFEFESESDTASDFRFVGGVRLVGLEDHATVDIEGSIGYECYGAGLVVNFHF